MEDLLASLSGYLMIFVAWVIGITALYICSALVLVWFASRRGWLDITETGPRWFRVVTLLAACIFGLVIGLITGSQVSVVRTGSSFVSNEGSRLLNSGLNIAIQQIGINGIEQEIDLGEARLALERLGSVRLVGASDWRGPIINGAFDRVRERFLSSAEHLLTRAAPGDRISLAALVDTTWNEVHASLRRSGNAMTLFTFTVGYMWLVVFGVCAVSLSWIVRHTLKRVMPTGRQAAPDTSTS